MSGSAPESRQSMRAYCAALARSGELVAVLDPVSTEFEIAACLAAGDAGPAISFDHVDGHRLPVVGNLLNSLDRIALGLGTTPAAQQETIIAAINAPRAHSVVADPPCQQIVIADPDIEAELPVPRFFEAEDKRYITAGLFVAKDRQTGQANLSIARIAPLGGNRAFVGIAPNHHLALMAQAAAARGECLDIAVCIGNHPAVLVASCLYLGLGDDELQVAGALLGEPLEVARAVSRDLLVPAHAECVLEGTIDATAVVEEGPVSEFHGMYETYGSGIVATFSHLTRRRDAWFQVILPGYHREHCLLGGVAIAAGLARAVRTSVSSLAEVAVGFGGAGRLHAVVSLHQPRPGEARKAMFAVWAAVNLVKQVVVVDDDVDPWDPHQVEWAIAARCRFERDLLVVPAVRADRSEPLEQGGTVSKLGIDATCHAGDRPDWALAKPPAGSLARARELLGAAVAKSDFTKPQSSSH